MAPASARRSSSIKSTLPAICLLIRNQSTNSISRELVSFPLSVSYDLALLRREKPLPGAAPHDLDLPKAPHLALCDAQPGLDRRLGTVDISAQAVGFPILSFAPPPVRAAEGSNHPKIAPDMGPDSRRGRGHIARTM